MGILWLGSLIGWDKPIIQLGVTPFLLAELFKISILALLAKNIFKLIDYLSKKNIKFNTTPQKSPDGLVKVTFCKSKMVNRIYNI